MDSQLQTRTGRPERSRVLLEVLRHEAERCVGAAERSVINEISKAVEKLSLDRDRGISKLIEGVLQREREGVPLPDDAIDISNIRPGRPEDHREMMDLALKACADNGLTNPNPMKLLQEIYAALCLHRGIVGVFDEKPIRAAALLRIDSLWYSDEESLVERAIFVDPEFRAAKDGRAKKLCAWVKHVQKQLELPLIIGILSSERTEAKVKLYERQFGRPSGAYWILGKTTGLPDLKAT